MCVAPPQRGIEISFNLERIYMSFEYIIEQENTPQTLSVEQEASLAKKIVSDYLKFDENRSPNLSKSNALIDEIFFKSMNNNSSDKKSSWKAKVKTCKVFMLYQTLKAFIWKNVYSNVNSMFDVSGENQDSDSSSNKQKAMLVDILEKMDYQKTCDEVIDNALLYGELISFTAWKTKEEEYRRPIEFFKNMFSSDIQKMPQIISAISEGKNFWIDSKKIYDNPFIYPVNPSNLVFDVSQLDNWDACPKIYRSFRTPEDIINNQLYIIDKITAQNISALISQDPSYNQSKNKMAKQNDQVTDGETVEVLEHWGDVKMSDGSVLHNWHVVVVARKYLVRFHKNESIINPFTYGTLVKDPETKRGISPLYSILSLAHSQEELFNRTLNLQALTENPPLMAPEGFFSQDEIDLYPGKIIEYGDNLSPNAAFKQLTFNNTVFLNDINFLDSMISEVSGIYPSMTGTDEASTKTATEITTKTQGQLTRLAMLLDIINQYFVIPDVRNVAKLCADFKSGVESYFDNKNNQQNLILVDDNVRQGDYKYTYSDRSMMNEKSAKADLLVQAIDKFSQILPLNLQEIFTWYFEQKGVENPERFLAAATNVPAAGVGQNAQNIALGQNVPTAQNGQNPNVDVLKKLVALAAIKNTQSNNQQNQNNK